MSEHSADYDSGNERANPHLWKPDSAEKGVGVAACDLHHFTWTWPIEGGEGAVGVCELCGAVTTGERDAKVRATALMPTEQVCTNRHGAGPCDTPRCACVTAHVTPHHDAQGHVFSSTEDAS